MKPGVWMVPVGIACQEGWCRRHGVEPVPGPIARLALREPRCPSDVPMPFDGLYTYQQDAIRSIVGTLGGRCLLADEMGLGKTRQAIAFIAHYGSPALVICPAFLQSNWEKELSDLGVYAQVMSFDIARRRPPALPWRCIVVDEAHYIKERLSMRAQAIVPLLHECEHVLLCTGTPCPSRPAEIYTLLHALRPAIVPSFAQFAMRYCNARKTQFTAFDTSGASRKEELAWLIKRAFMIRRTKDQVMGQLPLKTRHVVNVQCDPEHINAIDELQEKFEDALDNAAGHEAKCAISELFRVTCDAKLKATVLYAEHRARNSATGCVAVFAHHQKMMDALEKGMQGMRVVRIDGKTNMHARAEAVKQIQDGGVDAALLSMGAAGVGLTMTACNQVVFAELPWTPATLRQCEDRVHRIGQKNTCNVTYVICEDTLDTRVWNKLYQKEKTTNKVIL